MQSSLFAFSARTFCPFFLQTHFLTSSATSSTSLLSPDVNQTVAQGLQQVDIFGSRQVQTPEAAYRAAIFLPSAVVGGSSAGDNGSFQQVIAFTLFSTNHLFPDPSLVAGGGSVGSPIVSATVQERSFNGLQSPVVIEFSSSVVQQVSVSPKHDVFGSSRPPYISTRRIHAVSCFYGLSSTRIHASKSCMFRQKTNHRVQSALFVLEL